MLSVRIPSRQSAPAKSPASHRDLATGLSIALLIAVKPSFFSKRYKERHDFGRTSTEDRLQSQDVFTYRESGLSDHHKVSERLKEKTITTARRSDQAEAVEFMSKGAQ